MESHPSFQGLSEILAKYPRAAGAMFQAYNDVIYAQQWADVEVVELPDCKRGAIKGRKPDTDDVLHVVPCTLAETLSISWLQSALSHLLNPPQIYLAITSEDASIVYYKISQGIVKPPV